MNKGYKSVFLGYILATFHLTIQGLQILPNFIGFFIAGIGIAKLYDETQNKAFRLAKNAMMFLCLLSFLQLFQGEGGALYTGVIYVEMLVSVLYAVTEITIYYYLFEGSIDLLCGESEEQVKRTFEHGQRYVMIMMILLNSLLIFTNSFQAFIWSIVFAIGLLIIRIYVICKMNQMKHITEEKEAMYESD